jgi:hypothetical protein
MTLLIDPAVSAAHAAWASIDIAYQQLWASWIAAAVSTAILIWVAYLPLHREDRARKERLRAVSIALQHALELLQTVFDGVRALEAKADVREAPEVAALDVARTAVAAAQSLVIDDATLLRIAVNISTAAGAMKWTIERIAANKTPATADHFLMMTGDLEPTLKQMKARRDEHWAQRLR